MLGGFDDREPSVTVELQAEPSSTNGARARTAWVILMLVFPWLRFAAATVPMFA